MKEVNKEIITKDIVSVYVSDDGKEFNPHTPARNTKRK